MSKVRSQILSIAANSGDVVVTNDDLAKVIDTNDEWIVKRTGIRERRYIEDGTYWSDMVMPAVEKALDDAKTKPEEIGLIVTGTLTGDLEMPSAAGLIQARLGVMGAGAFNLQAACSGFLYSVTVADRFIRCEPDLKVLVVGGDAVSRIMDKMDRSTAVLFGDGGGAAVMGANTSGDGRGILSSRIYSSGEHGAMLYLSADNGADIKYGYRKPGEEMPPRTVQMRGNEVFKIAVHSMERASIEVLEEAGIDKDDIDVIVPHQANIRIIQTLASRLGVDMERVYVNVDRFGNTSAGTIPLALTEAVEQGMVKEGSTVLMPVFGGGLTWGVTLMKW
ncbi:MAG: 3-oxoacyl-ACP synthase [Deltaproteobacteria bacterium]|nr:MAG: 3-oxoacyl-ACP synthase [Deltaproteobacteria bacterium]